MTKFHFISIHLFKVNFSTLINGFLNKNGKNFIKGKEKSNNLLKKVNQIKSKFAEGGGERAHFQHVTRNRKLLVSDRLKILFDKGQYLEIGQCVGYGMSYGDIPRAGTLAAIGKINDKICVVGASDATVKSGASYPITITKQLRLYVLSMSLRIPFISIIDSSGAFLPLQAEIFPDKNHGGRIFYNLAVLQSKGIPVVSLVCGSCTAGAAYIPTMSTENGMILTSGHIFLGGPPLVKAAIGEVISADELGGALVHNQISGCSDYIFQSERDGLLGIRSIISTIPQQSIESSNMENSVDPLYPSCDLNGLLLNSRQTDDTSRLVMMQILARVLDGSCLHECKSEYGTSLITGFGKISGYSVGVLASHGSLSESDCVKGSQFIMNCAHRNTPMISFVHCAEEPQLINDNPLIDRDGLMIRAKSSMMRSMATRNCKLITLVVGDAVGLDYICMGGPSMEPNFIFAWINSRFGWSEKDLQDEETSSALKAAGNLTIDEIIEPRETRNVLTNYLTILHVKSNLLNQSHSQAVYRF